ncbi:MAG: methyltransferase [Alphaproteobacteria bacterium]|nr:methyltransferase [Alphaproteobacteria bacterium]
MKTQEDTLLGGKIKLLQPYKGQKVSFDTILLAKSIAPSTRPTKIADIGAAHAPIALILAHNLPNAQITAVEIDPDLAELAAANATPNIKVVNADIMNPPKTLREFDLVITNPPFFTGNPSPDKSRAAARIEKDLAGWLKNCVKILKNGGELALIHDAGKTAEIAATLTTLKMGNIRILPIFSFKTDPTAIRVIIKAAKAAKSPARILKPLIIRDENKNLTPEADATINGTKTLAFPK